MGMAAALALAHSISFHPRFPSSPNIYNNNNNHHNNTTTLACSTYPTSASAFTLHPNLASSHELRGIRLITRRVVHVNQLKWRPRHSRKLLSIWWSRRHCDGWKPSQSAKRGSRTLVACTVTQDQGEEEDMQVHKDKRSVMLVEKVARVAGILATLIVATAALFARSSVEQLISAKKKKGKAAKKTRLMPLEERAEWTKDLPLVQDRMPYSDVILMKKEQKLNHIIKHPNALLRNRPHQVFVVLNDQSVLRTVLPAGDRDSGFWNSWDELKLQEAVVDAYTPAAPPVELQSWATKGPSLTFLWGRLPFVNSSGRSANKKQAGASKPQTAAQSRLRLLEQMKLERERERVAKEVQKKRELVQKARAEREAKAKALGIQESKKKQEMRAAEKLARKTKLAQEIQNKVDWDNFYYTISRNEGFRFCLGVFFFWLFYQTIVVGVKKRKQDYEDRIKIEQAESEERKKLREWEKAMETAEAISMTQEINKEDMSEAEMQRMEEAQKNPQVQLGLRFMKSGAHVRRAKGRRPPQYLDLDADVKFADVAGLGDIRKELEEIVDFFTYGEKYRRRGSRIPGPRAIAASFGNATFAAYYNLDTLQSFCHTWGLTVNLQKTKIMIFNTNRQSLHRDTFLYDGQTMEIVTSYTYLGVVFSGPLIRFRQAALSRVRHGHAALVQMERHCAFCHEEPKRSFHDLELVKPTKTRLLKVQSTLRMLVVSDMWNAWCGRSFEVSERFYIVIISSAFWDEARSIVLGLYPLQTILRLCDCEGSTMGLLYEFMRRLRVLHKYFA